MTDERPPVTFMVALDTVVEFDDVLPGDYTVCIHVYDEASTKACQAFTVSADASVNQVFVDTTGAQGGEPFTI